MFKRHLILFHSLFVCFILIYIYVSHLFVYGLLSYSERVRNFAVLKFFCSVFLVIFFLSPCKICIKFCVESILLHFVLLILKLPHRICNSPNGWSYNSCNVNSENIGLDQLIIPKLIFFLILTTYLVDVVLIL